MEMSHSKGIISVSNPLWLLSLMPCLALKEKKKKKHFSEYIDKIRLLMSFNFPRVVTTWTCDHVEQWDGPKI